MRTPRLSSAAMLLHLTQEAQAAKQQVHGYRLDKSHVLAVNLFDDIDRYARVPDEYAAPPPKEFKATVSWVVQ